MSESQQQQIDPSQKLTVVLTFAEWRLVLGQLAEGPFKMVMPLIAAIERQCNDELSRSAPQPGMMRGNGAAAAAEHGERAA